MYSGYVHKFGNNIDTDVIIPARYCTTVDKNQLAKYCMYDIDPHFSTKVKKNDVIVAGYNFGCGSSREAAPIAIKSAGIHCVIAKSFARIFYRNAINIGLMVIESSDIVDLSEHQDLISVDTENNQVIMQNGKAVPYSSGDNQVLNGIIQAGGLVHYINGKINAFS